VLFVSATPGPYELKKTGGEVVEQVIRPTGLLDPRITVKPARGQVPDLLHQIQARAAAGQRTLIIAFDHFFAQYRPGQGDKPRRLTPDMPEYIERIAAISRFAASFPSRPGSTNRNWIAPNAKSGTCWPNASG